MYISFALIYYHQSAGSLSNSKLHLPCQSSSSSDQSRCRIAPRSALHALEHDPRHFYSRIWRPSKIRSRPSVPYAMPWHPEHPFAGEVLLHEPRAAQPIVLVASCNGSFECAWQLSLYRHFPHANATYKVSLERHVVNVKGGHRRAAEPIRRSELKPSFEMSAWARLRPDRSRVRLQTKPFGPGHSLAEIKSVARATLNCLTRRRVPPARSSFQLQFRWRGDPPVAVRPAPPPNHT
jgi:hypothetical protein